MHILVKHLRPAPGEIGGDVEGIRSVLASLDTGNNALDAAPACGAIVKLLETPQLGLLLPGLEARLGTCLQRFDMTAQGGGGRDAEDEVENRSPGRNRSPRGSSNGCRDE
jgi:hypothetical protein